MPDPTAVSTARLGQPKTAPRPLVLRLRGGETVSGNAHIPTIQALAPFLASRKGGLLTLTSIAGGATSATATHVMLRLASVLYGWSSDRTLAVEHKGAAAPGRRVRVTFDDHSDLEGIVTPLAGQRVSDFLARAEDFVVLRQAGIAAAPGGLADVAVHMNTVNTIRDLGPAEHPQAPGAQAPRETVVRRRTSTFTLVSFDDV